MSLLVFGGAGFVGSYTVRKLMDEGEDVIAVDVEMPDPPMPPLRDVLDRLKFEHCDTHYHNDVLKVMKKHGSERIINLVSSYSPELEKNPLKGIKLHLESMINILEGARLFDTKRIVFGSSGLVYGSERIEPVDEEGPVSPDSLYAACKFMNEYLGLHYYRHFGVDFIALRFSLIYGWGRGRRRVISDRGSWMVDIFEKPLLGEPVSIPFATSKGSLVYVKDLVCAILLALRAPRLEHRVFDVVSEPHSKAEVAEIMKRLLPGTVIELDMEGGVQLRGGPERSAQRNWQDARIGRELGYQPKYSLEAGIKDYIEMARSNTFKW